MELKCKTWRVAWFYQLVIIATLSFSLWYNYQQNKVISEYNEFTFELIEEIDTLNDYKVGWETFSKALGMKEESAKRLLKQMNEGR